MDEQRMVNSAGDDRTANNSDNAMRHNYRVLSDEEKAGMVAIKDAGAAFLETLDKHSKPSRCDSLARTKLEEAVMWAVKGLTG
ncbi:MAG TPA: hypothetical protein VFL74_05320 [Sphingomicrobium sp.]|nr:hypothetical protein [Sphingomicrobium sp.]